MDKFIIDGGRALRGTAVVNGSKNAALPILIATLLTDEECVIENVPRLRDIRTTFRLLQTLGKSVSVSGKTVRISKRGRLKTRAPYGIVKEMRASVLVAGPLLARFGKVRVALPGGCAIGLRPIDLHLHGFERLGAFSSTKQGDIVLTAKKLRPGRVRFRFPSVGATENLMTAAAALPGRTVIENAAREPEIADLADFLRKMGASVAGAGSSRIVIEGSTRLRGVRHRVIPDRIETGTLMCAVAAAGGDVYLKGAVPSHLKALIAAMAQAGVRIVEEKGGLRVASRKRPRAVSVRTRPHPGFPTDVQAPWMAFMARCRGVSKIGEDIFERRFLHAAELGRMGARIWTHLDAAIVTGVPSLSGAEVMASDIRAGAALVVAALSAKGRSEVQRVYHIDRGYEKLEAKLRKIGARIRRVNP